MDSTQLVPIAGMLDEAGYHGMMLSDHICYPRDLQSKYPYSPTGDPITAARIGQRTVSLNGRETEVRLATTRFMRALNLAGLPLLSIPCGFDSHGMPIGLQLIGGLFDESTVLEVGHAYERATDWHTKRPTL